MRKFKSFFFLILGKFEGKKKEKKRKEKKRSKIGMQDKEEYKRKLERYKTRFWLRVTSNRSNGA